MKIVCVGGGPAGLYAALLLGQHHGNVRLVVTKAGIIDRLDFGISPLRPACKSSVEAGFENRSESLHG